MRDRVFLEEGRVRVRIGVTEAERSEPQQLIIDLSWTPGTGDVDQDELSEVIDYAAVWESVVDILEAEGLVLPHPRLHQRAFVLVPLVDLNPDLHHPVMGRSVRELLDASELDGAVIRRWEPMTDSATR